MLRTSAVPVRVAVIRGGMCRRFERTLAQGTGPVKCNHGTGGLEGLSGSDTGHLSTLPPKCGKPVTAGPAPACADGEITGELQELAARMNRF
ncbi:hypothetical protein Sfum_3072 [Syntrophobacter fumaroxidans MPOB]|uniref:Uncharacterized protein n=1 Tax=Syntrophobacter fumaroxidans (strain DSM 10017 / MPOB) TaxID=335543 RepID=A0LMU3_SYNFM|nr:hypothetical protein Sfum_3072 [Syntrophobacter fumaroxidans MPOB]